MAAVIIILGEAGECPDASFGLFLVKLHKGAHILIEQTRVDDEVWLPKRQAIRADARLALLKNFRIDQDTTYRDYRKFRTDTKIIGMGEVQQPK